MRLKQSRPWSHHINNGNTTLHSQHQTTTSYIYCNNVESNIINSSFNNSTDNNPNRTNNTIPLIDNSNETYNYGNETTEQFSLDNFINHLDEQVCNQQYREALTRNVNIVNNYHTSGILEGNTEYVPVHECGVTILDNEITPNDEERMFEQSDTDEASENVYLRPVPRGIVNPNYPGFQHLAHTLQDYSKTIENFYQSENEMTDDDLDAEVIDLSYDTKDEEIYPNNSITDGLNFSNNNNNNNDYMHSEISTDLLIRNNKNNLIENEFDIENCKLNIDIIQKINKNGTPIDEIPDLLKHVNTDIIIENNNIVTDIQKDNICLDTDIENNFAATNIIGDFNKEVEDEINNIFNYNLNFENDLQELRKDIEDAFKKPIEDTINHISDVVNHVIKQLILEEESRELKTYSSLTFNQFSEDSAQVTKENESNNKKEMKLSRPTFLYIENNINSKTSDAFLSDAKDELQIYDPVFDESFTNSTIDGEIIDAKRDITKVFSSNDYTLTSSSRTITDEKSSISVDDNSNEISSRSDIIEATCSSKVDKNDEIPDQNKEVVVEKTKEKDFVAIENATKLKPLHRERRSTGATTNGARQRSKAQTSKSVQNKDKSEDKLIGSFDVYNIETAMPKLDLDAIESHLKAAKEAERRKRNDREEIRRRLAMGTENDDLHSLVHSDRPGRKPSLHSRLQSGMNLQICFMNETVSDNESMNSDTEKSAGFSSSADLGHSSYNFNHPYQTRPLSTSLLRNDKTTQNGVKTRPSSLSLKPPKSKSSQSLGHIQLKESDFHALQATLQTEARMALAQAKEMARIHMERERRCRSASPVTEMLRKSLQKANSPLAPDRRRVSRQLLTDMNVAQLQVIVNELHSQIELLNEDLVKLLMARDELHMGQDSMLVDIEDLTRYLGVKEQSNKSKPSIKSGVRRLASLVNK